MAQRDIVVIGASAGGIESLRRLVSLLPRDLPAAVFVTLHVLPHAPSYLPEILARAGSLPATHATDGMPIRAGHIEIAPPNQHLILERGHIHLSSGPKENGHRPAVNPMFRSAAIAYGARVIGIVLSGNLDDGSVGLWEIRRRGGVAIVQHPSEALYPGMPNSALANVDVDYSLPIEDIAFKLRDLVAQKVPNSAGTPGERMSNVDTNWTCPECRGPLKEIRKGRVRELQCRVGHTYSAESLINEHEDTIERALWSAVVALEENAEMQHELRGKRAKGNNKPNRSSATKLKMADQIREMIATLNSSSAAVKKAESSR